MFKFFKKKLYTNHYLDHHYATDAGHDIFVTDDDVVVAPHKDAHIRTELHISLPKGTVGLVLPRSSSSAIGLHIYPIVVDAGYSGEIMIFCHNMVDKPIRVTKFSRVAQLVILPCVVPQVVMVNPETIEEKNEKLSERGAYGYGSTGR